MPYTSYAQCREDVMLLRAVAHVHHSEAFYIDVGANDPEVDSVTKVFYEHGWHGINVEASETWFQRLVAERPRDINIHAAAADVPGEITFYDQPEGGLGTTVSSIAEMHSNDERVGQLPSVTIEAVTLTELCEKYAPKEIHFLKIDVEGAEGSVLRGMDFKRFKPWVLCIECHMPLRPDMQLYEEWDGYVIAQGYTFVFTDNINRYYVAEEHPELFHKLSVGPDDYLPVSVVRDRSRMEQEIASLNEQLRNARAQLEAARKVEVDAIAERDSTVRK